MAGQSPRPIRFSTASFPDPSARDTAVSRALLRLVAAGEEPETFRLFRPGRIVAFGPQDTRAAGYPAAMAAAQRAGFAALERLAGGRAALYHEQTLGFAWTIPDPQPWSGITERFAALAHLLAAAFRSLGVDARIGEVPGEYCPGAYSVNARGERKLMGVGQRLMRGAAHVGGVIVVDGSDLVRDVLIPVYEALAVAWNPATAGSLADEVGPLSLDRVEAAIWTELERDYQIVDGALGSSVLKLAEKLEADPARA